MSTAPQKPMDAALVVGGTSGIGLAVARKLLASNIYVILVGSNEHKFDDVRATCKPEAMPVFWKADLTRQEACDDIIKSINALPSHLRLRYFVFSAGVFLPKPFMEHTRDDFQLYHKLAESAFFITQAVAKHMKAHGGGSIVNVGSMWAKQAIKATPCSAAAMAKAGIHALTQQLAMELSDYHIRVNAVSPAVVSTPIFDKIVEKDKVEETIKSFDSFHPIGRVGQPEDLANVIEFLLRDDLSSWITGVVWDVDGGVMAGRN